MAVEPLASSWTDRLTRPVLERVWFFARKQIFHASRLNADDVNSWMVESPDHMGDPAKKADRQVHQYATGLLVRSIPNIQVFGEEEDLTNLVLDPYQFKYIAYLDAIDGSAQAWSLPGGWGHVLVIQQFIMADPASGLPVCEPRFVAVVDAEGRIVSAEPLELSAYVDVSLVGRPHLESVNDTLESEPAVTEWMSDYDNLTYDAEGDQFSITGAPILMVGGYKPKTWPLFSRLRSMMREAWSAAPVFNTAGSPVTRKVIQNADNVAVQLGPSTLWDGVCAALVARAGGCVIPIGQVEPPSVDIVWGWWKHFGYKRSKDNPDRWEPDHCIPPFVAGMDPERVATVAKMCREAIGEMA